MVDPFLDPLDTAPVDHTAPNVRQRYDNWNQDVSRSFQDILSDKINQEPTPILMPDALQIRSATVEISPFFSSSNPISLSNELPEEPLTESAEENEIPIKQTQREEPVAADTPLPLTAPSPTQSLVKKQVSIPFQPDQKQIDEESPKQSIPESILETTVEEESPRQEDSSSGLETLYTIQRGDTLSEIVLSALKKAGRSFNTDDVYSAVRRVAAQNRIANPNRIYPGRTLDLSATFSEQAIVEESSKQMTWAGDMQSPVTGMISSEFGNRIHPIYHSEQFHDGVDIAVPTGTPVVPIKSGLVTFSGEKSGYGQVVEIDHEDGTQSVYGHLSERLVQTGDRIAMNESLGSTGNSGVSTGPHLHLEIHQNGMPVDPLISLSRNQIESLPQITQRNTKRG